MECDSEKNASAVDSEVRYRNKYLPNGYDLYYYTVLDGKESAGSVAFYFHESKQAQLLTKIVLHSLAVNSET